MNKPKSPNVIRAQALNWLSFQLKGIYGNIHVNLYRLSKIPGSEVLAEKLQAILDNTRLAEIELRRINNSKIEENTK